MTRILITIPIFPIYFNIIHESNFEYTENFGNFRGYKAYSGFLHMDTTISKELSITNFFHNLTLKYDVHSI